MQNDYSLNTINYVMLITALNVLNNITPLEPVNGS